MSMEREQESLVSRRSLIATLSAALAGTALVAAPLTYAEAAGPDGVFAAIAAYQAAYDAHIRAFDAVDVAEEAVEAARKSNDAAALAHAEEDLDRAEAVEDEALRADREAWWDLTQTVPTTLAGLLAYARFFAERHETQHLEQSGDDAMQTIAEALEALTSAPATA
jgi:hypothetical protein